MARPWLLLGADGQVGWELQRTLAPLVPLGEVTALNRQKLDLSDIAAVRDLIRQKRPAVLINAAAYTAVDKAESPAERELVMRINTEVPAVLAEEAKALGAFLVHYSTDYVFDGHKATPYVETDQCAPLGVYGQSKRAGEQVIAAIGAQALVLRTSWVYGLRGANFLRTIQRLATERSELRVVADQFGAPTWSRMIAEATAQLVAQRERLLGLFHLCATGEATTWHGFARAIVAASGSACQVKAISTAEYPLPAPRPRNSQLDCSLLQTASGIGLPSWQTQLRLCLAEQQPK